MHMIQSIGNKIAIFGAGIMGVGLAHNFAEYGFEVVLVDNKKESINNVAKLLEESYRIQSMLAYPKVSLKEISEKIFTTADITYIKDIHFIVESTTENIDNKANLLKELNNNINENTILAINTSCIPIKKLSSHVRYPDNMLGIHFMNPVPIKSTVEIIKTNLTSEKTLSISIQLLKLIGKSGIVVNDSPGFVINRVFMVTINEAIKTLEENLCNNAKEIDDLFVRCLGHKMGPLMTADLIGLDTISFSLKVLYDEFQNDMYKPANLLQKLVNDGKLGRKVNAGLYNYN